MRNIVINSAQGGLASAGIWLDQGTSVGLEIFNTKILGGFSPNTTGIFQGGLAPIIIRFSRVAGQTKTIESAHNVSIGFTDLVGGPVTVPGNAYLGCMALVDEIGLFYPNTCPN
jgi:hypothetical protein